MTELSPATLKSLTKSLTSEQLAAVILEGKRHLRDEDRRKARAVAAAEKQAAADDEERYRAAEGKEFDDDPLADDEENDAERDEHEEAPKKSKSGAGSKAAQQKAKRTRYWEHSDEDQRPGESDEDTIVVSRPRAKKARGPQIVIGQATTVVSKLPPRRRGVSGHSRSASTATAATSSPSRLLPPSSEAPSTPARESDDQNRAIFTPYHPDHAKYATQGKQSPNSKTLLETANHHFRIKIALKDAFPDNVCRIAMAKASFIEACQQLNIPRRLVRFSEDHIYAKRMTDSIGERASQIRGEVKTKAQAVVSAQYRLASLSDEEVKTEVTYLLSRSNFHFSDTKERKGMFENTIIPMVLADQWFKRKSAEGAGQYSQHFNPCPLPLLALVITAVECALCDWKTGLCIQSNNQFSQLEYDIIYRKHISGLEKYKKKLPVQFAQLQSKTWRDAWRIAGRTAAAGTLDSDLDDDDFEDIKQRG